MTLIEKIKNQEQRQALTNHLEALKPAHIAALAKGLPPQEFKQTEAWIKALNASLKIVKSPKLQVLNP